MIDSKTLLPVVCLDENCDLNTTHPLPGIIPERAYLLIGQVAVISTYRPWWKIWASRKPQGMHHYILWDLRSGKGIPGMFHDDRFRFVRDDDDFF